MNEPKVGWTEEDLFNFKNRLAATQRLSALKAFANQLRQTPEGLRFLLEWARERRERGEEATAPAVPAAFSMLLADLYRDANEETLSELGL